MGDEKETTGQNQPAVQMTEAELKAQWKKEKKERRRIARLKEAEQQAAYSHAIESGDVQTIYHELCRLGFGNEDHVYWTEQSPRHLKQALDKAAEQRGVLGVADAVMGIVAATLGDIVLRQCATLGYTMKISGVLMPGLVPQQVSENLLPALTESTQGFVTMLKNYATARHALALGATPNTKPNAAAEPAEAPAPHKLPAPAGEAKSEVVHEDRAA